MIKRDYECHFCSERFYGAGNYCDHKCEELSAQYSRHTRLVKAIDEACQAIADDDHRTALKILHEATR